MNATLKNECLRAAFKLQKHRMEHALSVDPYRLYCVFGISSLEQDDGLIGHPFMSQYPEAASLKLFEAIEATTFCDDVFDAPVQPFSDSIYPAYMLSIQNVFDVPIDSVSGDGDLFNCLHPYVRKLISTGLFPEFSILTRLSGNSGCHKGFGEAVTSPRPALYE